MTSDNFKPSEHTDFYKEEVYKGSYTKTVSDYFSYDASVTLAFTKRLDKHQLNAVAVWNVKQSKTDGSKRRLIISLIVIWIISEWVFSMEMVINLPEIMRLPV